VNGDHPPQLRTNVIVKHRYRFTSTSATPQNVTQVDILGIGGAVCSVANTTLRMIYDTVKLHSVEVWAPPASQGAASTCSLEWIGGTYFAHTEVSDSSNSVAEPAHIKAVPPAGSDASFWMNGTVSDIMTLTCPVGSIIDVVCSHLLIDTGVAGTAYTVAAGSLGALYYLPLDGASDVYLPTSLTTTT
jgi:hypothetical protein